MNRRDALVAEPERLEQLGEAQSSDVSDVQGRVLKLLLTAAELVQDRDTLAQLAEDSGCTPGEIRTAAVALKILGLKAPALAQ